MASETRFFYIGPGGRGENGGTNCSVFIVADSYSKSPRTVVQLLVQLRQKLFSLSVDFADGGPDRAEVGFANTEQHRGKLMMYLPVTIMVDRDELTPLLQNAGFISGHPNSQ